MVILTHKKIREQEEWNQEVVFDRVHTYKLSTVMPDFTKLKV
jgi:hypothetical protein